MNLQYDCTTKDELLTGHYFPVQLILLSLFPRPMFYVHSLSLS